MKILKKVNLQKAAMFGLDARIALAIFGALSVISGAALYSAIGHAKTVRQAASLNELFKAVEQYNLDIGENLPKKTLGANGMNAGVLYTNYNNHTDWNGPYIGYGSSNIERFDLKILANDSINTGNTSIRRAIGNTWAGTDSSNGGLCTATDCYLYLFMGADISINSDGYNELVDFYKRLDAYIDGSDGSRTGRIRYVDDGSSVYVYYKLIPFDNS